MGQVLHARFSTAAPPRRRQCVARRGGAKRAQGRWPGITASAANAMRFGDPTAVQKWRRRQTTADAAMGSKLARSPVLGTEQEAMAVAFRRHALLPLDGCLHALQSSIPGLTRSSLHRCLNGTASPACPPPMGKAQARSASRPARSAICPCSPPSTAKPSSPSPHGTGAPRAASQPTCLTRPRRGAAPQAAHRADRQRRASETADGPGPKSRNGSGSTRYTAPRD